MFQGETGTIFYEMRLQRRKFSNELTAILDKYETDDGLSKEEFENEKKRLEPLWNELVNKTDAFITALEESDEDKSDLIEDTKMVLEFIEQKMATISCARNRNRKKIIAYRKGYGYSRKNLGRKSRTVHRELSCHDSCNDIARWYSS